LVKIVLPHFQNAREYEEDKVSEKTLRLVARRLREDGRFATFTKIERNGSHRRNDATSAKQSKSGEPYIEIAHVRVTDPRTRKRRYISLIPGHLLPGFRTPSETVASAVKKRGDGMSFQHIASAIGVVARTVASWLRRLERAKARLASSHSRSSLAKAARGSMQRFFRALHRASILVLSKLLADGMVI
jgi:cyclopropane fatty-acyl-phospholipid synthase-like methyltransferase